MTTKFRIPSWFIDAVVYFVTSPTSDGAGCAILASEDFVKRHGLQRQAVEIVAQFMSTDLPSTFKEKSCIKVVGHLYTLNIWKRLFLFTGFILISLQRFQNVWRDGLYFICIPFVSNGWYVWRICEFAGWIWHERARSKGSVSTSRLGHLFYNLTCILVAILVLINLRFYFEKYVSCFCTTSCWYALTNRRCSKGFEFCAKTNTVAAICNWNNIRSFLPLSIISNLFVFVLRPY